MVKIRLRRIGTKGRPFYRVVVSHSTSGRNGKFVEVIGTYDPLVKPSAIKIDEERALHWLKTGAQPTETTAYLLNKTGVLEKYFQERPNARKNYAFLDKRTAATSVASVVEQNVAPAKSKAEEPIVEAAVEAPAVEAAAETPVEATADLPAEETTEAVAEEATAPEAASEETPSEAPAEAPADETTAETPAEE